MLRVTLLLLGLMPLAQSQVTVAGRLVVPFSVPPQCVNGAFQLDNTNVFLTSTTINLSQLVGTDVIATGSLLPTLCTAIGVQQVGPAPYVVETCGGGALSCPVRVNLHSAGGGMFALFASLNNGFVPSTVQGGSFLLDPSSSFVVLIAPETGSLFTIDAVIPAAPEIQALSVRLQAVRSSPALGSILEFSTVGSVFTGTFTTPCTMPNC